jgi:hypothetical protein
MHSRAMSSWIRFASSAGGTAAAKKAPYRSNDDVSSESVVPLVPPMPSPHK